MSSTVKISQEVRDFYTREYDRIGAELVENESMGESRVALYLGVWSAAVAGVGTIIHSANSIPQSLVAIAMVGLAVVLALGLVTTVRILVRNYHSDKLIDSLMRLRHLLRPPDSDQFIEVLPWKDSKELTKKCRNTVFHTGLLQVLILANAIVPALGLIALRQSTVIPKHIVSIIIAALLLQLFSIFVANRRAWMKRQNKSKKYLALLCPQFKKP